eukprot:6203163-Pleurochrysis_carterae.AAC.2
MDGGEIQPRGCSRQHSQKTKEKWCKGGAAMKTDWGGKREYVREVSHARPFFGGRFAPWKLCCASRCPLLRDLQSPAQSLRTLAFRVETRRKGSCATLL